ncbi:MAG: HAD hydrolase-like protein [Treponema sp.]|nr:HAD hydrolase-like protein [Treponema sp.]
MEKILNILCADIGTTSLKMGIISQKGEVLCSVQKFFSNQNDSFLANQWLLAFKAECAELIENSVQISAICISGNGPTVVSESGRTLLWNNPLSEEIKKSTQKTKSLYIPQFLAFKKYFPDEWNASKYIFSGPEFVVYKLTGNAISVLPEKRFETAYWNKTELEKFGIETEKIPEFVPLGHNAGNATKAAVNEFGIPEVPVFCGGPDFITALLGTATVEPGKLCDRSGSSEGINLCAEKPVFKEGFRTLPSAIPGLWNISVIIPESGSILNEYKQEISQIEKKELSWEEIIDYSLDDKNSEGYRILCELSESVKNAVLSLKKLAQENNLDFCSTMNVTGGQAKNERWLEKKAFDCNINLEVCNTPDSELTGNAVVALYGLGIFENLQEAAKKIVFGTKKFSANQTQTKKIKIFKIPQNLKTIIFDIDSTLYTSPAYAFEQVDVQLRYWAKKRGITAREARNEISEFRKNWTKQHDGKKISLGNTLKNFGVTIQESVEMRKNLLEPANFLSRDEKLIETIKILKQKYKIICVTNNPVLPARKTLDALGISELIPKIIGLDTSGKSKPALEPFQLALDETDSKAEECLSVGDRYDMDLSLPLEMGMGAILLGGVSDVYLLPKILKEFCAR